MSGANNDGDRWLGQFSPVAFWTLCAFAVFVAAGWIVSSCWVRRQRAAYLRRQADEEAKRETPEQRQAKLMQSLERHHVRMVSTASEVQHYLCVCHTYSSPRSIVQIWFTCSSKYFQLAC